MCWNNWWLLEVTTRLKRTVTRWIPLKQFMQEINAFLSTQFYFTNRNNSINVSPTSYGGHLNKESVLCPSSMRLCSSQRTFSCYSKKLALRLVVTLNTKCTYNIQSLASGLNTIKSWGLFSSEISFQPPHSVLTACVHCCLLESFLKSR